LIQDWCMVIGDGKRISRILRKNYNFTEKKKGRTYTSV
jgi:hypothetical protein